MDFGIIDSVGSPHIGSFVPRPRFIAEYTRHGLLRPMVQDKSSVDEVNECLIEDFGSARWVVVQVLLL